jgi:DNA helicase HerA-like ATPase
MLTSKVAIPSKMLSMANAKDTWKFCEDYYLLFALFGKTLSTRTLEQAKKLQKFQRIRNSMPRLKNIIFN